MRETRQPAGDEENPIRADLDVCMSTSKQALTIATSLIPAPVLSRHKLLFLLLEIY